MLLEWAFHKAGRAEQMNNARVMQTFIACIKDKETGEYIESLLACFAAPTIRNLKPGTLISFRRRGDGDIAAAWDSRKEELLRKFKLDAFALASRSAPGDSMLLLMAYRKELLSRSLFRKEALEILEPLGYGSCGRCVESCLVRLGERIKESFPGNFPHEIGLFLGYPPEDVEGVIRNKGRNSLDVGYWKVYGDVRRARKTFRMFRRAEYSAARSMIRRDSGKFR
jgi:hypothetical protein